MADVKNLTKILVDARHGCVEQYSTRQANELLTKALIEANNGSTKIDYKAIRDGKCPGLFSLIEQMIGSVVRETIADDPVFMALVDDISVDLGDAPVFYEEDNDLFYVAEIAEGTQGIRRQRFEGGAEVTIPTKLYGVRIYEELNRVMAGRVDWNDLVNKVGASFAKKLADDAVTLLANITAADLGGSVFFPAAGTYDEDALLDLIEHVEASANGQKATILCTKKAARMLAPAIQGADSRSDLYNLGYYGMFYGVPVVTIPQRHKFGTTQFAVSDRTFTIIAGGEKPIKMVHEGEPLIIDHMPETNGDLTYEHFYTDRYGMGIIVPTGGAGVGRYQF